MASHNIIVTSTDLQRLRELISDSRRGEFEDPACLHALEKELDRATVVEPDEVPADVVTMNSAVRVQPEGSKRSTTWTIVYPERADIDENRMSILAPIGTALLGYRTGDEVAWDVPAGRRRFRIVKVLSQPEAAGQLDR